MFLMGGAALWDLDVASGLLYVCNNQLMERDVNGMGVVHCIDDDGGRV